MQIDKEVIRRIDWNTQGVKLCVVWCAVLTAVCIGLVIMVLA